jgi:hypothetical protein
MPKKLAKSDACRTKIERGHNQPDKWDVLSLQELPLFAAACQPKMETDEMLTLIPLTTDQTVPPGTPTDLPPVSAPRARKARVEAAVELTDGHNREHKRKPPHDRSYAVIHDKNPIGSTINAQLLIERVRSWQDLNKTRQDALVTAIRHTAVIISGAGDKLIGVDPWSCAGLNRCLFAKPPRAFGMSKGTFRNVVTNMRYVFSRLELHADAGYGKNRLSPNWAALYNQLETVQRQSGLVGFLRFLTLARVEPSDVKPDAIDSFEDWCRSSILCHDAGKAGRRVAGNWDFARKTVPGWPQLEIKRTGMRDHYAIPMTGFPASFQADVEIFLKGLMPSSAQGPVVDNPYKVLAIRQRSTTADDPSVPQRQTKSPRSIRRPLSSRTIATRRDQIKLAATALVLSGTPIADITCLAKLINPVGNVARILDFHLERRARRLIDSGEEVTTDDRRAWHLAGIGEVLRQIAKFHAPLSEDEFDELVEVVAEVKPEAQHRMTDKNMSRLRALFEEPTYAKLLHLPDYWIGNLVKDKLKPQDEALVAMYALAVDILLVLPLRRENLLELRLDTHLRRLNGRALINEIAIPAKAVKNRTGISWPIERQLAERIETYITKYRPVLAKEGNRYLFPGIGDHHRDPAEFGAELSNRVEETLGVEFNMHLVRHFSVVKYLKSHPGAYEIAAMLLGHKNPETTRRFYAGLEIDAAARHANAVLTEDRRRTKIIAIGAYHRPPSRRKLSGGRS